MHELYSSAIILLMAKKITTIEQLAIMIQQTMASKEDVQALREEMNIQFEKVDKRFDKLEVALVENHEPRLVRLEEDMVRVKEAISL